MKRSKGYLFSFLAWWSQHGWHTIIENSTGSLSSVLNLNPMYILRLPG